MPNSGPKSGLVGEGLWRPFTPTQPILRAFVLSGAAPTQPNLGSSTIDAWYAHDKQSGTVTFSGKVALASDFTNASGDHVLGLLLPVPAYRSLGGADVPIGTGMAWQGTVANLNVPLRATLMDPMSTGIGSSTQEDSWAQFFIPYSGYASGTGTITSAATSVTITHNLGHTPTARDFNIMPTAATTNSIVMYYVDTITSTQANVNVRSAPGASGFNFSWSVQSLPNGSATLDLLLNSGRPFGGGWVAGYVLSWHLRYQARR
jgi:hypothetical protein